MKFSNRVLETSSWLIAMHARIGMARGFWILMVPAEVGLHVNTSNQTAINVLLSVCGRREMLGATYTMLHVH